MLTARLLLTNALSRLHRATWVQTELFLSFPPPTIASITLFPRNAEDTAGRFRVWVTAQGEQKLVWDRKTEGGFPEVKVLVRHSRLSNGWPG
jgi:predicted Rdx family selenoprotein